MLPLKSIFFEYFSFSEFSTRNALLSGKMRAQVVFPMQQLVWLFLSYFNFDLEK